MAIPLLVIMAGSGPEILTAYPMLGASGDLYGWYSWQGVSPPGWLRFGGWLAGARHWHFALAWFLVANGAMYLVYLAVRGEWRRRLFLPGRDTKNAVRMVAYYLRIRKTPPAVDFRLPRPTICAEGGGTTPPHRGTIRRGMIRRDVGGKRNR